MKASLIAMPIIFGIVLLGAVTGIYAGFRRQMNLDQWTVAGRGFGLVLIWLLMAGEVYTTFAFLGASGWAYSRGGPVLYILAYLTLAYVISFFILPRIWEVGRRFSLHTQSDFFLQRYASRPLAWEGRLPRSSLRFGASQIGSRRHSIPFAGNTRLNQSRTVSHRDWQPGPWAAKYSH
jgi:Na+/pantothenate symporter